MNSVDNIKLKSGDVEFTLVELKISCCVTNATIETKLEMGFKNPTGRQVEASLDLPLPSTATVNGYSYEFNGQMLPASLVEKEKARATFEKEVRKGKAVSLVEHVRGNNFNVRIFPCEPNKVKRVMVSFLSDLEAGEQEGTSFFSLPFLVSKKLDVLKIDIESVLPVEPQMEGLKFQHNGSQWNAKHEPQTLDKVIRVDFPAFKRPEIASFISEKDKELYFMTEAVVPAAPNVGVMKNKGNVLVLWDASYSTRGRKISQETLNMLIQGSETASVISYRNVAENCVKFKTADIDAGRVLKYIEVIPQDGGTEQENLPFPTDASQYSRVLWFTDGFSTLSNDLPKIVSAVPVFAFVESATSNMKLLKHYTALTGGGAFEISQGKLSSLHDVVWREQNFLLKSVNGSNISAMYPSTPMTVQSGETIRIFGTLKGEKGSVVLDFGSTVLKCDLSPANRVASSVIGLLWAQQRIDYLNIVGGEKSKQEILMLGRKFSIVTPDTSLLVLTELNQYLEHKIEPNPEALPSLNKQYHERLKSDEKSKEEKIKEKLNKVAGWWKTRLDWYNRSYSLPKEKSSPPSRKASSAPSDYAPSSDHSDDDDDEMEEEKEAGLSDSVMKPQAIMKEKKMESLSSAKSKSKKKSSAAPGGGPPPAPSFSSSSSLSSTSAPPPPSASPSSAPPPPSASPSCAPAAAPRSRKLSSNTAKEEAKRDMLADECEDEQEAISMEMELQENAAVFEELLQPVQEQSQSLDVVVEKKESKVDAEEKKEKKKESKAAEPQSLQKKKQRSPSPVKKFFGSLLGKKADGEPAQNQAESVIQPESKPVKGKRHEPKETKKGLNSEQLDLKIFPLHSTEAYIVKMKKVSVEEAYKIYLAERATRGHLPAFYLQCAHVFFDDFKDMKYGVRVLSTLVDLKLDDYVLLRIVANKLSQEKFTLQAEYLFRKITELRGEEPQSWRELAIEIGDGQKRYQEAVRGLYTVVEQEWPIRFQHIEDEILLHINRFIQKAQREKVACDCKFVDRRFLSHPIEMDFHSTISWNADDICIDMHIDEKSGLRSERCYYGHYITATGGFSTPDYSGCTAFSTSMLREYMRKELFEGSFNIGCNMYSNVRQDLVGAAVIWFNAYTNFGRENEEMISTTVTIAMSSTSPTASSRRDICCITYKK